MEGVCVKGGKVMWVERMEGWVSILGLVGLGNKVTQRHKLIR